MEAGRAESMISEVYTSEAICGREESANSSDGDSHTNCQDVAFVALIALARKGTGMYLSMFAGPLRTRQAGKHAEQHSMRLAYGQLKPPKESCELTSCARQARNDPAP